MSWVAVDKDGSEFIYEDEPYRLWDIGVWESFTDSFELPKGSVKKLTRKTMTWKHSPIKLIEQSAL